MPQLLWCMDNSSRHRLVGEGARPEGDDLEQGNSSDEESAGSLAEAEKKAENSGSVEALVQATAAGASWPRANRGRVLEQAGMKGHLLPLLENFEMPLYGYERLADNYLELARGRFLESEGDNDEDGAEHGNGLIDGPSRFAWLLSNYLMVPEIRAEEWLAASQTPMVVFESKVEPVPCGFASFPAAMGAFYLKPRVTWKRDDMNFTDDGTDGGTLRVESENLELTATKAFDFKDGLMHSEHLYRMIPEETKKFVFVYPHPSFTAGGFLYLDKNNNPIAVNQLTLDCTRHGFWFGDLQTMTPEVANDLKCISRKTTLPVITSKGARCFCFVGPGQCQAASFKEYGFGGFAYWFEEEIEHRFFPIRGFTRVVERGPSSMIGSAMLFPKKPSSDKVCEGIVVKKTFGSSSRTSIKDLSNQMVVKVSKLNQKGLTHPVVLRGLVLTPNDQSLESVQIQAIVSAAFSECSSHLIAEMVMNVLLWLSLTAFTKRFRTEHRFTHGTSHWDTTEYVLFALIVAPWLLNVGKLLLGVRGHRITFGSLEHYWQHSHRLFLWWLQTVVQLVVILQLWTGVLSAISRSVASISLASCGALLWVQMLYLARPFTVIGTRFLPIVSAWGEMTSFLLVTCFLLGASMQASYALTVLPLSTIVIDTYLMGFVGEMRPQLFTRHASNLDSDLNGMSDMSAAEVSRTGFGYLLLCLSSFILMVSMANIFIQVMGDAYNDNKNTVHITLTRARAEESLITTLWRSGGASLLPCRCRRFSRQDRREFVWFTQDGRSALPSPRSVTRDSAAASPPDSALPSPRSVPRDSAAASPPDSADCGKTSRSVPRDSAAASPSDSADCAKTNATLLTRGLLQVGKLRRARDTQ